MAEQQEPKNPLRSPTVIAAIITGIIGILTIIITGIVGQNNAAFQTSLQLTAQAAQAIDTATWTARLIAANATSSFVPAVLSPTISPDVSTIPAVTYTETPLPSATIDTSATALILEATNQIRQLRETMSAENTSIAQTIGANQTVVQLTSIPTSPSVTQIATTRLYPCEGRVQGFEGLLNQVHVQPLLTSPNRRPVERGSTVTILQIATDYGITWYQIQYQNDEIGWIEQTYIVASSECPDS